MKRDGAVKVKQEDGRTASEWALLREELQLRYDLQLNNREALEFLVGLCAVMEWKPREHGHILAAVVRFAQRLSGQGNFVSAHDLRTALEVLIINRTR